MKFLSYIMFFIPEGLLFLYMLYKTAKMFLDMRYSEKYNTYLDKLEPIVYLNAYIEVKKQNPKALNKEIYEYLINLK